MPSNGQQVVDSLPGLARVAATAAINTTGWGLRTTARNWRRVGRAATNRDEAVQLIREVGSVVGTVGEIARQVADGDARRHRSPQGGRAARRRRLRYDVAVGRRATTAASSAVR